MRRKVVESKELRRGFPPRAFHPRSDPIQVHGNTTGLKASQVKALERLGRRRLSEDRIVTNDLARELTEISADVRRQVGVLLDRSGSVQHVMIGTHSGTELPDWGRLRAGRGRLRGLRLIHTHLAGEGLTRDDETDLALLRLDAVVSIQAREDGLPGLAHAASLCAANDEGRGTEKLPPCHPADFDFDFGLWIRDLENELTTTSATQDVGDGEQAILVSVTAGRDRETLEMHVEELRELARAAGVHVVDTVTQSRPKVDPRTVIGSGKLSDLVIRCFQSDVDLVIFDQDMTPAQARNLSERMELRVIDRTQLILDIFAQRATSGDGKLQVELAQLRYRMPRLAQRADLSLSRLAGGIGGRGPGETKLENDRRRVRDRITRLEREPNGSQRKERGDGESAIDVAFRYSRSSATRTPARAHSSAPSPRATSISKTRCSRLSTPFRAASAFPVNVKSSLRTPSASFATFPRTSSLPSTRLLKNFGTRACSFMSSTPRVRTSIIASAPSTKYSANLASIRSPSCSSSIRWTDCPRSKSRDSVVAIRRFPYRPWKGGGFESS